ncbi:hypothetical protein JCM6882_002585 [Rhodosporidiobolus microsporus]
MTSLYQRIQERCVDYVRKAEERYIALSPLWKGVFWIWVALHFISIGGIWYIGMDNIFAYFAGLANDIRELPYGWLVLTGIIIVTSLPPLFGYGTAQTLVGFAYGVNPGFWISAGSCLAGGAFAFLVMRRLIHWFAPYLKQNTTFDALSKAVKAKGLPLIIMIRLCPFPYPYSNLFFASIESVTFIEFMLATLTITPKLLLHVFIGHRTYLFADPESRHNMDNTSWWLNMLLMVGGSALGFGISWYLYKETMKIVAETNGQNESDLEAGLLEDVDEMLNESGRTSPEGGNGGASGRGGRAEEARGRESEDRWSESFSDFGEDDERTKGQEGDIGATGGRRDSEAWGLSDIGEEGSELVQLEETRRDKRRD